MINILFIIGVFFIWIFFLLEHYEPFIDIVLENNKYKVLLWYNVFKWDNFLNKPTYIRKCKRLFIV